MFAPDWLDRVKEKEEVSTRGRRNARNQRPYLDEILLRPEAHCAIVRERALTETRPWQGKRPDPAATGTVSTAKQVSKKMPEIARCAVMPQFASPKYRSYCSIVVFEFYMIPTSVMMPVAFVLQKV